MSDSDPPPDSAPPERESSAPPAPGNERRRRRLEGIVPEIVRRAVELGVEKTLEAPDNVKNFVGDLKLPKEIAHYVFQQIDETKNGLFRVVAGEIRDFLEHTNFAGEIQKILTTVQFEVNTTIRFTPNDGRAKKKKKSRAADESPAESSTDALAGSDEEDMDGEGTPESDRHPLPKPEVKTTLHKQRRR